MWIRCRVVVTLFRNPYIPHHEACHSCELCTTHRNWSLKMMGLDGWSSNEYMTTSRLTRITELLSSRHTNSQAWVLREYLVQETPSAFHLQPIHIYVHAHPWKATLLVRINEYIYTCDRYALAITTTMSLGPECYAWHRWIQVQHVDSVL